MKKIFLILILLFLSAPSYAGLKAVTSSGGGGVASFSAGTTGLTPSSATTGAVTLGGTLAVANGGSGTNTAFTQGSVVFAGASGTYNQNNANFFWDNTNNRLGIGTASPVNSLQVTKSATGALGPVILLDNSANTVGDATALVDYDSGNGSTPYRGAIQWTTIAGGSP
jgi:hypothetical protein